MAALGHPSRVSAHSPTQQLLSRYSAARPPLIPTNQSTSSLARIYGVIDIACDVVYGDEHDTTCGEVVHSNTHNDRYDAMHGVIQDDIRCNCGVVV